MKIATYHKKRGDFVELYKGKAPCHKIIDADRIYITSLFTFHYDLTLETVNHYRMFSDDEKIFFGGIAATIMSKKFRKDLGERVNIQTGQRTSSSKMDPDDDVNIDELPLDYDILDDICYEYSMADNFFAYATRGCGNKCKFCAVPILEPKFANTNYLKKQISYVRKTFGDYRNIRLMDNNVLFSDDLKKIARDLGDLGFIRDCPTYTAPNEFKLNMGKIKRRLETGNDTHMIEKSVTEYLIKFKRRISNDNTSTTMGSIINDLKESSNQIEVLEANYEWLAEVTDKYRSKLKLQRYVDFNQGIDARLLTDEKMEAIADLPLSPFRLAYDNYRITDSYNSAFKIAYKHGVRKFSNYMLYNYNERPEDLWYRLNNNVQLCKELPESRSFSFPMKYAPIDKIDRKYVGEHWNKKRLDAMNVILNVTKGVVMIEEDFFGRAYGCSAEEFLKILTMPNEFIKYRTYFDNNGMSAAWSAEYDSLSESQREELLMILSKEKTKIPRFLDKILTYYKVKKNNSLEH